MLAMLIFLTVPAHAAQRATFNLSRTTNVFASPHDDVPATYISPQTVTILQVQGHWMQISTWLGPKWINTDASEPLPQSQIDPARPMIAITFDDGPNRYAAEILDVFEFHDARATFFVLGESIDCFPEDVKRMHQNGFDVFGHTYDHPRMTTLSEDDIAREISETHNQLEQLVGSPIPKLFRPPYGAYNAAVRSVAADLGFSIIHWSVCPADWTRQCPDEITRRVLNNVRDGDIVLLHDIHTPTARAVRQLVPQLVAEGFQLVTVSDLLYYRGVTPQAGGVYRRLP